MDQYNWVLIVCKILRLCLLCFKTASILSSIMFNVHSGVQSIKLHYSSSWYHVIRNNNVGTVAFQIRHSIASIQLYKLHFMFYTLQ